MFSYRIVSRRADIPGHRFERVTSPEPFMFKEPSLIQHRPEALGQEH
jgi:hypothetical protein